MTLHGLPWIRAPFRLIVAVALAGSLSGCLTAQQDASIATATCTGVQANDNGLSVGVQQAVNGICAGVVIGSTIIGTTAVPATTSLRRHHRIAVR